MNTIHQCGRLLCVLALFAIAAGAHAQGYPSRPVRLVVADAAGGAPDQLARLVAQKVSETLGQQVIVDNRPGAGGALGADLVAKSPPDGYTLLLTTTAIYAILPNLRKDLPYDPVRDFVAGRAHRDRFERARGQRRPAGAKRCGPRPVREGASRRPQLRLGRRRHARASCRRDAEPARRHQGHPRPLQGRRAGAARRDRRQRAVHHHVTDRRWRAHERGARARDRDHRHRAQSGVAGPADRRRYPTRLRDHAVVGHRRAGRYAGRRREAPRR